MATELQRQRLRDDIGATVTSLSDDDADAVYTRAAESYPTEGAAQDAQARIIAIRGLLASSAKMTTYRQNASSENASDVFKHLSELLKMWRGELALAEAAASTSGAARFGGMRRKPKKIREYPD